MVLQAMDVAGKDSAMEHVMSGVNPQGVQPITRTRHLGHDAVDDGSKPATASLTDG